MLIQTFPSGPFETNAYVVSCQQTKNAVIIDPAPDSFEKIRRYIESQQLQPIKILLTHTHWDHTADVSKCKLAYNIPVSVHLSDKGNLESPGSDGLPCWVNIEPVKADALFKEGDIIEVGQLKFKVIETPGHTPGGVCFYSPEQATLFSGDTLFKGSIGNLSFPTCNADAMWMSLDKLAKLPAETKVYPGHGPTTTIGQENWLPNAKRIFG